MIPVHWLPFLRACEWLAAPVLRGQRAERGPAPGRVSCRRRPGLGPQCDGLGQVPAAGEASGRRGSCPASAPPLGPRAVTGSFVDRRERNTFIHSLVIRQQAPLGSAKSLLRAFAKSYSSALVVMSGAPAIFALANTGASGRVPARPQSPGQKELKLDRNEWTDQHFSRLVTGECALYHRQVSSTGLGGGVDKGPPDFIVCSGKWDVGRIYQARGGPDNLRWFWSMNVIGPMARVDRVAREGPHTGSQGPAARWRASRHRGRRHGRHAPADARAAPRG